MVHVLMDMMGQKIHMKQAITDEDLKAVFDIVTSESAKALRIESYGIEIGAKADFVTLSAANIPEAVVAFPGNRRVFKGGRLVAQGGKRV